MCREHLGHYLLVSVQSISLFSVHTGLSPLLCSTSNPVVLGKHVRKMFFSHQVYYKLAEYFYLMKYVHDVFNTLETLKALLLVLTQVLH